MVLDEARVQKFFKSEVEFVEDLTDALNAACDLLKAAILREI